MAATLFTTKALPAEDGTSGPLVLAAPARGLLGTAAGPPWVFNRLRGASGRGAPLDLFARPGRRQLAQAEAS